MHEQTHVIQKEVLTMLGNVNQLDDQIKKLQDHFGLAVEDIQQIRISTDKITKQNERIEEIEVGKNGPEANPVEELPTPKPRVISASGE